MKRLGSFIFVYFLLMLTGCTAFSQVNTSQSCYNPAVDEDQIAYCDPKSLSPFRTKQRWEAPPQKTIVIDPGHGGKDQGTHSSVQPAYEEKKVNLATARLVQRFLQKLGYKVIMTRTDDSAVELSDRAVLANKSQCDLFVSIHYNSAPNKQASGIEVYYFNSKEDIARAKASEQLAGYVLQNVIDKTQAKARGVRKGNFAVIRETRMPAILIEGGFLTNDVERDKILEPAYRKKIALGIVQGIEHYFAAQKISQLFAN